MSTKNQKSKKIIIDSQSQSQKFNQSKDNKKTFNSESDSEDLFPIPEEMKEITSKKFIQIVKEQVGDFNEFMRLYGINMKDEN